MILYLFPFFGGVKDCSVKGNTEEERSFWKDRFTLRILMTATTVSAITIITSEAKYQPVRMPKT